MRKREGFRDFKWSIIHLLSAIFSAAPKFHKLSTPAPLDDITKIIMRNVSATSICMQYVTWSREISRKIFNFEMSTPPSGNLKMLYFDANAISIGYLVTELWAIYQCWKQYKTEKFDPFPCQYLKNNIYDIRLIPPWSCHICCLRQK